MLKSLFVNKTGMLMQQRRLDISANNLANLNTVGFKKDKVFFHQLAEALAEPGEMDENRAPGTSRVDFSPGALQHTGNSLDVAIDGEGFFVIQTPEGNYYTRAGSFHLDGEGRLVTPDGYPVVTDGGELQIAGGNASMNERGEVIVNGQSVGRLRVVGFADLTRLERVGDAYYKSNGGGEEDIAPEEINLRIGYLELSNVNPIMEMIHMIEINREFELGQKAIHTQDQTLDKLINQAGRM